MSIQVGTTKSISLLFLLYDTVPRFVIRIFFYFSFFFARLLLRLDRVNADCAAIGFPCCNRPWFRPNLVHDSFRRLSANKFLNTASRLRYFLPQGCSSRGHRCDHYLQRCGAFYSAAGFRHVDHLQLAGCGHMATRPSLRIACRFTLNGRREFLPKSDLVLVWIWFSFGKSFYFSPEHRQRDEFQRQYTFYI